MGDERWQVDFYEDENGEWPVREFLRGLTDAEKKRFRARVEMLEQKGTWIGRPVVDFLEDNLYELRFEKSPHNPRILFCALVGRRLILLHGFGKTGQPNDRVPESEKHIARTRRDVELKRETKRQAQTAKAIKPPRKR